MEKHKDLIEKIEKMTVLELAGLIKALEEKFGVSAQAVAVASVAGEPAAEAASAEEKTTFSVILTSGGDQKIQAIKTVREITGLGLKESKEIVDGVPKAVKEGISKADAEEIKTKFEAIGAAVEIK